MGCAAAGGFGATGPHAISFLGTGNGQLVMGLGTQADKRAGLGAKSALFGRVLQVNAAGRWMAGADVAAFDQAFNPIVVWSGLVVLLLPARTNNNLIRWQDNQSERLERVQSRGQKLVLPALK